MEVSEKLKERFCKDCNIPLKLFKEPYFTDRLQLYDSYYNTLDKWNIFVRELEKYKCEQYYLEEYNRVKDAAINDIKLSDGYNRFNEEDMGKYSVKYKDLPSKDIYKPSNIGKLFISIDMRKANFSALKFYDKSIFSNADTWEEFVGRYTENKHIVNSKYIRQVILGNCNPKRQVTYEKYLMGLVLEVLIDELGYSASDIAFFSNDEIVIDVRKYEDCIRKRELIEWQIKGYFNIPFRIELFYLRKITGTNGYYKEIVKNIIEREYEFKCLNNYTLPFVLRKFNEEEITENDKVFYHEELLSKFIEIPEIGI
ncbi:MAG: hypothetical protein ACLS20_06540 [Faecalimonas umbilicata]|uniref:hypothetical protein n=1 Tax=Faecalimonas umbilicata TaxID=1912855 RepID=UPI0039931FB5